MPTLGSIRAATRGGEHDLWPRLRARLDEAEEQVTLELPAFTWRWRVVAAATATIPFLVPEPLRFLAASGLI